MIEQKVLQYLTSVLPHPIYMEEPRKPESRYYLMEKTGAGQNDRLFTATLAIQSYADSMIKAAELNDIVIGKMLEMNIPEVTRVRLNSDYNFTDEQTKRYRYQAVFSLVFYREDY